MREWGLGGCVISAQSECARSVPFVLCGRTRALQCERIMAYHFGCGKNPWSPLGRLYGCNAVIMSRDAQSSEPPCRHEDAGLQGGHRLVIGLNHLAKALSNLAPPVCEIADSPVEVCSEFRHLLGISSYGFLAPTVGNGLQECDENRGTRRDDALLHPVFNEPGVEL